MHITSRDNSLLRQARAVRDGKIDELIFIEGLRLCEEAQRSNLDIEAVLFRKSCCETNALRRQSMIVASLETRCFSQ